MLSDLFWLVDLEELFATQFDPQACLENCLVLSSLEHINIQYKFNEHKRSLDDSVRIHRESNRTRVVGVLAAGEVACCLPKEYNV